jgi:hypothetical protein
MTSIILDTSDQETAQALKILADKLSDHATRLQEISGLLARGEEAGVLYWSINQAFEGVVTDLLEFHGDDAVEFGLQIKALIDRD